MSPLNSYSDELHQTKSKIEFLTFVIRAVLFGNGFKKVHQTSGLNLQLATVSFAVLFLSRFYIIAIQSSYLQEFWKLFPKSEGKARNGFLSKINRFRFLFLVKKESIFSQITNPISDFPKKREHKSEPSVRFIRLSLRLNEYGMLRTRW